MCATKLLNVQKVSLLSFFLKSLQAFLIARFGCCHNTIVVFCSRIEEAVLDKLYIIQVPNNSYNVFSLSDAYFGVR